MPANVTKIDTFTYHLECQLPNSLFASDNRGALRVPFILGMQARVYLTVFQHELSVEGKIRNLSVGGCLVYISLEDSMALSINQTLPNVALEFPTGTRLVLRDAYVTCGLLEAMATQRLVLNSLTCQLL